MPGSGAATAHGTVSSCNIKASLRQTFLASSRKMESPPKLAHTTVVSSRAWYAASIAEFLQTQPDTIVGQLVRNSDFALLPTQKDAWLAQIGFLQDRLGGLTGALFLEFNIPRMGRRIDAVLLVGPVVFVIEFKVGESEFDRAAVDQVWDYALDLKNFHEASHPVSIIPILIATEATESAPSKLHADDDKVYRPILVHPAGFREAIDMALRTVTGEVLDEQQWSTAPYHPTPTIMEAARALYAQHSVEAIARYDAGAQNLRVTSSRIEELVDEARAQRRKLICFVTGVPGAGKTLVGLNVATRRRDVDQPTHAVFLSGNGPLVAVLREALTRDEVARQKKSLAFECGRGKLARASKLSSRMFITFATMHCSTPALRRTCCDLRRGPTRLEFAANREFHAAKKESARVLRLRA